MKTSRTCLLVLLVVFGCAAPLRAEVLDLPATDVHAPHRLAEAERKAAAAARWDVELAKSTVDPNQDLYDVGFMELDLDFDTIAKSVVGTVSFRVRVVEGPLASIVLDLDAALTATGATVAGLPAVFVHAGDRLTLTLDRAYSTGETIEFAVSYGGVPNVSKGAFGVETVSGQPLIWSLSEPFGARTWWPCKDTPSDKADSVSIKFTVPSALTAVSNGTLEQVVDLGTKRRFEWFERYPITTYLISIAAYPYTEQTLSWQPQTGAPMPVTVWSWPSAAGAALNAAYLTRDMLTAFEERFGPYPFVTEKYGQAQFTWGGGMEHQTASSMCCWGIPYLIAHELAHQWYGDQVTCADFTEIWVNEGFATYSEALWREVTEGWSGYIDEMLAARYLGGGTIRVPEESLNDFGRIFNSGLSYNKASWVVHMLRGIMGDEDFFDFLKSYASDPELSYGVATTDDVRRVAEAVSGRDLGAFFTQWIDQPWYPTFVFDWNAREVGGTYEVDVEIAQVQSHWIYTTPITVRVTTASGSIDHRVELDGSVELATFASAEEPLSVQLDPDQWVLRATETSVPSPTFDRGVLVVNGIDWGTYGAEITSAYADSAFSGEQPFEFWDLFPAPGGGYVPQLPAPRGNGALPPEVLGDYSSVVWVGNDYLGDLPYWIDAAILSYLNKGGNVLLLTRRGSQFLTQARMDYLGTEVLGSSDVTVGSASPQIAGLVPMPAIAQQSLVTPLVPEGRAGTHNLFLDASAPSRSLGHWRPSDGTATVRTQGGHFAHVAGRPYRWNRTALRSNVETILAEMFGEPFVPVAADPLPSLRTRLLDPVPNPFNPRVRIGFVLAQSERIRIEIFDVRGRRVRTLLDAPLESGEGAQIWDGTDDTGAHVASGIYTVLLRSGSGRDMTKVTLLR